MKSYLVWRRFIVVLVLLTTSLSVFLVEPAATQPVKFDESVIRIAPLAPVLDQNERLAELARRRAKAAKEIGSKALLIMLSAEPRLYTGDVDYEYRQENNLYYLTNLNQPRATLVIAPGESQPREILFLPRSHPTAEVWSGHMYTPEEASRISGVKEIWAESELTPFLNAFLYRKDAEGKTGEFMNPQAYRPKPESLLLSPGAASGKAESPSGFDSLLSLATRKDAELYLLFPGTRESREYRQEQRLAAELTANDYQVRNALNIFSEMRLRKSPLELQLLQHAIDITGEAQQRAWLAAGSAKAEYEVQAQVDYTFKLRNADHWGYPHIVGCGPNATILHYIESQGTIKPGQLLLMDIGAEYGHYTADVTRTIPISGKFTTAQAELYQVVYDAQEAAARTIKPGALMSDAHRAATEVIKDGLLKLGLITNREDESYRLWFMHGTSHWLGMNVHDVGSGGTKLEPGMVFTNEPGIYVRETALDFNLYGWKPEDWEKFKTAVRPAFEKYRGTGVRIEDDMLVTADGVRWMTAALPRKISEIEEFIARGRK